jgi:para-nitrobenzyl esterase
MKTVIAMVILFATIPGRAADSGPIVNVTGGQIRGTVLDKGGAVFKGIPYAQPPVGDLRWREPMPVKPWTGLRETTAFGPICAQILSLIPNAAQISKEDCLYLNVWTSEWPSKSRRPVMLWIPGGGNFGGASSQALYDGESLARHGVVLVSINYRLGSFGFFSHPALTRESPHHVSGNQGILDQIAALHWVHENISTFGGDPDNVTIFGNSAGSLDVSVLMTSPLSKGLFRKVIAESGSVVLVGNPRTLQQAEERGEALAASWKIPSGPTSAKSLRSVSAADILKAEPDYIRVFPNLGITVDGYVVPKRPAEVFATGKEHNVALLHGNTSSDQVPGTSPPKDLKRAVAEAYGPIAQRALKLYGGSPDPLYGTRRINGPPIPHSDVRRCCSWHGTPQREIRRSNTSLRVSHRGEKPSGRFTPQNSPTSLGRSTGLWSYQVFRHRGPPPSTRKSPKRCSDTGRTSPRLATPTAVNCRYGHHSTSLHEHTFSLRMRVR